MAKSNRVKPPEQIFRKNDFTKKSGVAEKENSNSEAESYSSGRDKPLKQFNQFEEIDLSSGENSQYMKKDPFLN